MVRLLVVAVVVVTGALASRASERPTDVVGAWQASPAAAADTLRYEVEAGKPLIVGLPSRLEGQPASYRLISAPSKSWLVDRTFLWVTDERERGRLAVEIEASAEGVFPETLVLLVDVLP